MLREPNFLTITKRTNLLEIKTHLPCILESIHLSLVAFFFFFPIPKEK